MDFMKEAFERTYLKVRRRGKSQLKASHKVDQEEGRLDEREQEKKEEEVQEEHLTEKEEKDLESVRGFL